MQQLISSNCEIEARSDNWILSRGLGKGQVAAVFPHSFDLQINGTIINGNLRKDALHPLSLLVSEEVLNRAQVGMPAEIQGQHILLGSSRYPWKSTINPPERFPNSTPSPEIRKKALGILRSLGRLSPLSAAWLGMFFPDLAVGDNPREFAPTLARVNEILRLPALDLSFFINDLGKGEGLTPSFDDFLSGILLARVSIGGPIHGKEAFLSALPGRTPPTSIWQLTMALEGFSSIRFEQLLGDLQKSSLDLSNVLRCLHTGHSSGTDLFCGILAGFDPMVALAAERKE